MEENTHSIPKIDPNRRYWLVRTNAGDYYDEFFMENYIGIGWNKLKIDDLQVNRPLSDIVSEKYPEERHNYVANQVQTFVKMIKEGDIVLIPSKNSFYISFGEVIETEVYEDDTIPENIEDEEFLDVDYDGRCPYIKRKSVKWIKTVRRDSLDPYLYKVIYSHHTISDATPYAPYIDRLLHSFFVKGDKAHFILQVQRKKDINAVHLINLINETLKIPDEFQHIFEEGSITSKDVEIKLNVQSPGPVELIGNIQTIFAVAAGYIAIFGGNFKILGVQFQTDGIAGKVMQFIQERHNRNIEEKKMEFEDRRVTIEEERLRNAIEELEVRLPPEIENNNES